MKPRRKKGKRLDVAELIGGKEGRLIAGAFRRMEIAEEEIARAGPTARQAFMLCAPSPALENAPERLYRAHVREIVARFVRGDDTRPGTDAELLAGMVELSLRAPLTGEAFAVYVHLFRGLFPGEAERAGVTEIEAREKWPGQVAEAIRGMRRRLTRATRRSSLPRL